MSVLYHSYTCNGWLWSTPLCGIHHMYLLRSIVQLDQTYYFCPFIIYSGDPDKCDLQGHTAVHFAALAGHLSTLMFLQSFGCNIWGLTNDYRTAKDLSAENGHKQCLDLLDDEAAKQSANSRKQVIITLIRRRICADNVEKAPTEDLALKIFEGSKIPKWYEMLSR